MRACGECSRSVTKYGPPIHNGYFIDQIVICKKCGWVGVETEILDETDEPAQMDFMKILDDNETGQAGS